MISLVLGGVRSGKSRLAEERVRREGGDNVLYVGTAVVSSGDPDLAARVEAHRARRPPGWGLIELAGGGLEPVLRAAEGRSAVLFDSLTLWISARMAKEEDGTLDEVDRFLERAGSLGAAVILVSDELGLGGVAGSPAGRAFADLLGLVNQRAAFAAGEVHLCVAGIPMRIK